MNMVEMEQGPGKLQQMEPLEGGLFDSDLSDMRRPFSIGNIRIGSYAYTEPHYRLGPDYSWRKEIGPGNY